MKKTLFIILCFLTINLSELFSQEANDTIVYLITCGPGTETYSIYGHSALRVVISNKNSDTVYNWGVFDFDTPNFAWKFAKGRLNYMLDSDPFERFLRGYFYEKRYVISQEINLSPSETSTLMALLSENLKPENLNYRYDFFYDDCSTRIRDLLEKSVGEKLLYPPADLKKLPTFREMLGKYQEPFPWLHFGINLIMGSRGDKSAGYRDRMFLPIDLKAELSLAVAGRSGKMIPLLQNPEIILDFQAPVIKRKFLSSPVFLFTLALIIVLILSTRLKSKTSNNYIDILIFSVYSILAIMMIFFNFFTDHQQMKVNYNLLWLNPFIILCLISVILKTGGNLWFRVVFFISGAFLVIQYFLPQTFDMPLLILDLILIVRCAIRGNFTWNPIRIE